MQYSRYISEFTIEAGITSYGIYITVYLIFWVHTSKGPAVWGDLLALSAAPRSVCIFPWVGEKNRHTVKSRTLLRAGPCSFTYLAGIQMIPAWGGLTSPSPREAAWTAPAECSAGPGPVSALGLCGPVPALTRRCSASVSHFLPWSCVVHCGAPGTAAPTRDSVDKPWEQNQDLLCSWLLKAHLH